MRVLLSTYGSRGDVEPLAALAAELREFGAEVRVCAPPDREFEDLLEGVGATLVPLGMPARELVRGVTPGSMADARRISAELVRMRLDMAETASDCDALLATGLPPAGAREVAERIGIPYVFVAFVPGILPSPHHRPLPRPGKPLPPSETDNRVLWEIDAENAQDLIGEPLNVERAAMGLPPVRNVRDHVLTDRPWLAADPVLAPWRETPTLDVVQTGAWFLPDERPLPREVEEFIEAGAPPVYIGFGSMPVNVLGGGAADAVAAVRSCGRRVLVSRGWADLAAAEGAGDCLAVGEVNHRALFGRVAAVVHHGGAGTTSTAARAGVPQVVVPQIADQPYWANRVAALGIGAAHDGPAYTAESLAASLATALRPRTRERAEATARQVRSDGARAAARMLVDLIR